jgi:3-oxoacyl-[acyl-carrier protein] reductase
LLIIWGLKHVIITGGTGGLGKAIAEQFRMAAWKVSALGRKDLNLDDSSEIVNYFSASPCDLLICAAGVIDDQPLAKMDECSWDEIIRVNYTAAKQCALAAIPKMIERGSGHVVFISSYAANHPTIGQAAYATAKAEILGITRDLALYHGSNNIRVNAILPGFMNTPMTENVSIKRKQEIRDLHALGEFNRPEVVAEFIHFLEERMPHTSGQVFQLDSRPSS